MPGEYTTEAIQAHFDKKLRELTGVEFEQARDVVAGL
jgi:hypothetical protein